MSSYVIIYLRGVTMSSRMNKYYENDEGQNSRFQKNASLYQQISKNELNNFEVKSNATILGDNKNEIDVEKIKKILDTKYNESPRRQSLRMEEKNDELEEKEPTKEYDINVVIEKAKEQKVDNYEEERLKKLRDTQFDILKNLNLEKENSLSDREEDDDEPLKDEDKNLKDLINTIALNEKQLSNIKGSVNKKDSGRQKDVDDSLDILSDLRGSDNTEVLEGLKEEIEAREAEMKEESKTEMINSFYTSSNALQQKDFEDIDDFSKSIESNNTFIKVIIIIVVLIFLIGIGILIKSIYFK